MHVSTIETFFIETFFKELAKRDVIEFKMDNTFIQAIDNLSKWVETIPYTVPVKDSNTKIEFHKLFSNIGTVSRFETVFKFLAWKHVKYIDQPNNFIMLDKEKLIANTIISKHKTTYLTAFISKCVDAFLTPSIQTKTK